MKALYRTGFPVHLLHSRNITDTPLIHSRC